MEQFTNSANQGLPQTGALTTDRMADHHTQGASSQTGSRVEGLSQTQGFMTDRMADHSQGGMTHHHRSQTWGNDASPQTGGLITDRRQ